MFLLLRIFIVLRHEHENIQCNNIYLITKKTEGKE